jgi:hypothetical protein
MRRPFAAVTVVALGCAGSALPVRAPRNDPAPIAAPTTSMPIAPTAKITIRFFVADPNGSWIADDRIEGLEPGEHYRVIDEWHGRVHIGERIERRAPRGHVLSLTLGHSKSVAQITESGPVRVVLLFHGEHGGAIACSRDARAVPWWSDAPDLLVDVECDASSLPPVPFDVDEVDGTP